MVRKYLCSEATLLELTLCSCFLTLGGAARGVSFAAEGFESN